MQYKVVQMGLPAGFSEDWRLAIFGGFLRLKIWRSEDSIILSDFTQDMWCLRLKIWRQCSLNLKTQNIVSCAGSPTNTMYVCGLSIVGATNASLRMEQLSGTQKAVTDIKFWDIITLYNGSWYMVRVLKKNDWICIAINLKRTRLLMLQDSSIDKFTVTYCVSHICTYHYRT